MKVLVTVAVDAEFAPWRQLRKFQKNRTRPNASSFVAHLGGNSVEVLLTGIGQRACEQSLAALNSASAEKPDVVISAGLAGALSDKLKLGDIVAPRRIRILKNDASAEADPTLLNRAIECGACPIENLITVHEVVQHASEKSSLAFFGQAVDMESAIIMSRFGAVGVPAVTIRAISDAADEDLPVDFDRCLTRQGAVRKMQLVNALVRRPGSLPNLIRFGRQSITAAQKLAAFLDKFVASAAVANGRIAVA